MWARILLALVALVVQAQDGECPAGSPTPGAEGDSTVATPLRWRGYPYKVRNKAYAKWIYGGQYVTEAFRAAGFDGPVEGDDWDVLWTHRSQAAFIRGKPLPARNEKRRPRIANHCAYFNAAGDKCKLAQHVRRVLESKARQPNGRRHLRSFELLKREQVEEWRRAVEADRHLHWVLKPCSAGASKGIRVLPGEEAVSIVEAGLKEPHVAQEYVDGSYMGFGQRKFHLRLYVFVPEWSPAKAYLYNAGLVFRSVHQYRSDVPPSEARDIFSAISESVEAVQLADFWDHLNSDLASAAEDAKTATLAVANSSTVWTRVQEALSELLGMQLPQSFGAFKAGELPFSCFDVFGVDVILDAGLEPLVMELNVGPNLWVTDHGEANTPLLSAVKSPLLAQLTRWLAIRLRAAPSSEEEAGRLERDVLKNFTRIL